MNENGYTTPGASRFPKQESCLLDFRTGLRSPHLEHRRPMLVLSAETSLAAPQCHINSPLPLGVGICPICTKLRKRTSGGCDQNNSRQTWRRCLLKPLATRGRRFGSRFFGCVGQPGQPAPPPPLSRAPHLCSATVSLQMQAPMAFVTARNRFGNLLQPPIQPLVGPPLRPFPSNATLRVNGCGTSAPGNPPPPFCSCTVYQSTAACLMQGLSRVLH